MEREISDVNILEQFSTSFLSIVEKYTQYIVVSGFVAIASGRMRGTEDIDVIIAPLSQEKFTQMHDDLLKNSFEAIQSVSASVLYEYLTDSTSIQYVWKDKLLPIMEVKFAKDELDMMQIHDRKKLDLTGLTIWFSSVEANIAFKEEYLRSEKDLGDAKHLRKVYTVNEGSIQTFKKLIKRYRL